MMYSYREVNHSNEIKVRVSSACHSVVQSQRPLIATASRTVFASKKPHILWRVFKEIGNDQCENECCCAGFPSTMSGPASRPQPLDNDRDFSNKPSARPDAI